MKRYVSVVLVLLLLSSCFCVVANAEDSQTVSWGYDIRYEIESRIAAGYTGQNGTPIQRFIQVTKYYGYMPLMDTASLKMWNCRIEEEPCEVLQTCTWEDLRVLCTKNEELASISFRQNNDGLIEMQIQLTEEAKKAKQPQTVEGIIFIQREADGLIHVSEGIPFCFALSRKQVDPLIVVLVGIIAALLAAVTVVAVSVFKKKD